MSRHERIDWGYVAVSLCVIAVLLALAIVVHHYVSLGRGL